MKKIKYILSLINTHSIKKDEVIRTEDRNRECVFAHAPVNVTDFSIGSINCV